MMTLLALPIKGAPAFSMVGKRLHNILSTSITLFDVGRISFVEDGDGVFIDNKFPILSLNHAVEFAVGGLILEHEDHVVEVSEGIISGPLCQT